MSWVSSCLGCAKRKEPEVSELDFAHCSLDNVPTDIFAFERTLEKLCLDYNNIRDLPRQLFQCQELKELSVCDNDVHLLPSALASLGHLVRLNVSKNVLTDIPETIKQLKCLEVLDVSVNPLQKVPEGCTQLLNIAELYLNDTFLEFLPANFGRLVKLKILELRENNLTSLPKSLSRLECLERLDVGQNDIVELPDVIGSLVTLKELWVDANRIQVIPAFIGQLKKLHHLEASFNNLENISEEIGQCQDLVHLSLSTNDLKFLPHQIGRCERLITLKVDDNQLESVPQSVGQLCLLEELVVSQNYLENIPSSIGLCRNLHTLNIDDNDVEYLPKELGSCVSLKILSAHGNRLTTLPAELDHIAGLSVINLTANMIQNLPVSFMKLRRITALWLSENQTKPLVQLNQDTDPETGQRVLTNFLLPQMPEADNGTNLDAVSDSGSFHASVWEEERQRKSHVKWAGEADLSVIEEPETDDKGGGHLRREPTPFPKEMRAMAKRVQALRAKESHPNSLHQTHSPSPVCQGERKRERRPSSSSSTDHPSNDRDVPILIREAKVTKPQAANSLPNGYHGETPKRIEKDGKQFQDLERSVHVSNDLNSTASPQIGPHSGPAYKLKISSEGGSRDSGVATPSDGSLTSPDSDQCHRNPSDPLPQRPEGLQQSKQADSNRAVRRPIPPPYHIAAALSKRAGDFQGSSLASLQIQSTNSASDTNSVSESEVSTTASSLQTIVRAPTKMSFDGDNSSANKRLNLSFQETTSKAYQNDAHALQLRKVSEQLLANPRTRQSVTGSSLIHSGSSRPGSFASPSGATPISMLPYSRSNSQMGFGSAPMTSVASNGFAPSLLPRPPNGSGDQSTNGLLTTIEQATISDGEGDSDAASFEQPNYENVSTPKYQIASATRTEITRMNGHVSKGDRLSTSQFVMSPNGHGFNTLLPESNEDNTYIPMMAPKYAANPPQSRGVPLHRGMREGLVPNGHVTNNGPVLPDVFGNSSTSTTPS
ncbi:hypothetical protein TCAL_00696 [Tigriopus californicus]|uniref:Disease resistance R13L4/SHOC-2-like LRR domain-containing protein n=1 Tax=Tigriopus californicus TaxID=6832 RepID=A0A553PA60_TIGCA|nr:protein scribble homolog [Tigriopus californicus]TRY74558.1 hypothetical protein TCAL_00696 [Tigriopus californicus]|eukprot:TCALIF_00696-PA protein Name:"Similar to ERBB2IP Protein LAP2 (Homo sapiens)" AED:0.25 eAED:0.25 QI:0/-1/0/1/-1/1/1/0/998